jgi:hypothetical protein
MYGTRVSGRWWPVALLALFWACGCAMFQDEEPNFRDHTGTLGEGVRRQQTADSEKPNRPVKLSGAFGGVTSEAQQIERNLGIR